MTDILIVQKRIGKGPDIDGTPSKIYLEKKSVNDTLFMVLVKLILVDQDNYLDSLAYYNSSYIRVKSFMGKDKKTYFLLKQTMILNSVEFNNLKEMI